MNESIINDNTTHDPEDYEAIHDHLADEDDIYNESYIISKKNYEINMDKWKPGTPLWITGSSGDGKSTYANQLAKEKKAFLVPLDLFLVRIAKPKEKYDKFLNDTSGTVISNGSQMVLDYINKHPEIPWADNVKGNWGTSGQDPELWNGLFDWLIDASAKNPKYKTKLIIFEGCNICLMPVEKAVKFPFIIMGTSRLQSSIRRIKRDKKEHDDYSIFKLVYRELKRSTKGVLPSLNKTKDNFEKGLKKQMKTINESYVIQESQQLIQRNLSKLDYDPKTQTVDSHIKDAKTGKNFRIRLIVDDNHPFFKTSSTPAAAYYANADTVEEYLDKSLVLVKSRLLSMRNNASVAIINHEIGHVIDKLHKYWPDRLTPEDVKKLDKLRAATNEVFENTDKSKLNKHDRVVNEPFADAFASNYVSTHALYQGLKTKKGDANKEYAELKQLRKEFEKLRKKFPLEERKKIEAEINGLENKLSPLREKRNELEADAWDNPGKHDAELEEIRQQMEPLHEKIDNLRRNELKKFNEVRMKEFKIKENRDDHQTLQKRLNRNDMTKKIQAKMNQESCLIMDNDEFFMEASKNPDVKARQRTVKNLRKLGVDRAHEVDNKKLIDKLERQLLDLSKKWRNGEMSFSDYYDASEPLKKQIRKLEKGIDIEFTDSYGKKHKTKLSSNNQTSDSYDLSNDTVNITPKIMNSNKFDSTLNHELGHVEQNKRYGFDKIDRRGYDVSDNDDYLIKCAKLFVKKNLDKLDSHDNMWTELHADVLSCKKSGFGKMLKDVYSFKKSKTEVENAIDDCIKRDEEYRTKIEKEHLKAYNEKGERFTPSQKDVDECIALYEETKSKLEHTYEILNKRYKALEHQKFFGPWDMSKEYKTKLDKVFNRVKEKWGKIYQEKDHLDWKIEHNGLAAKDAIAYNKKMESHLKFYADELKDLQAAFTTYDYRIMFMEDMKHIHEGHPGRCSMKYPPMTPEDKKYMQEAKCILVSNEEFFEETYKPFDEYLKLNHYDPKTGTIDASNEYHYGQRKSKSDKRRPIGMPHSKKQWNRINKFLRENDYDPKTETIRTDVVDPKTGKKKRIKFNITDNFFNMKNNKTHAYFRYNDELENPEKDGERDLSINMQPRTMGVKPRYSNFSLKHEEGHYDDYLAQLFNTEHLNEIRAIKQMALDFDAEEDAAGNYDKLTDKNTHDRQSREHYADWYGAKHNPYDNSPNGVHLADGFNQTHDEWKRKVVSEKGGNKKNIGELIETLAKSGPANFENNVKDLNLSDKDKAKLRAAVVNYARTKAEDRNLNSQKQLDKEKIHQQDDYKQMKSELRDIEKKLNESIKNKNSEDSEYFKNKYLELEKTFKDTFKPAEQSLEDEYSEKRKQLRDKLEKDIKDFSEELNNKTRKRLENASNKEKHKNAVAMANKRYAPHDQGLEGREKFVNYANEKLKENPNVKINKPVDDWLKFNVKTESSNVLVSNEEFFTEAKSTFKQDMHKVKVIDDRKAHTNKSNDNKSTLKEYIKFLKVMEGFKDLRYDLNLSHNEGCITFMPTRDLLGILDSYDHRKLENNIFHGVSSKDLPINLEEFDVKKYDALYKEIKNLVNQFIELSDIKEANKDKMHIKSLRNKIFSLATDLSKSEVETKMIEIETYRDLIKLYWFPSSYRKIDTKKYHLFVHRSDITNLTELIPQMFQKNKKFRRKSREIRIYRDAVVHFWAFKKTNDPAEIARQIKDMNEGGYIFGNNFYIYEPKSTDVFYIDGNYDYINDKQQGERYVDPFSDELVPVTIVTKTPLKIKKTSLEEIKKMIGYKTGDIKQIFDDEEASDKINEKARSDVSLTEVIERNNDSSSSDSSSSSSYSRRNSSTNTEEMIKRRNEALYKKSKEADKPVQAVSNDKLKSLLANKKKTTSVQESCLIMDNDEFFGLMK